eukprot:c6744_g1_i1.p2 GENE.c6744_g1_i1~~c6744_g1_i1.p2  ORF type:complete len:354 (+),score=82.62 c6744_g1_i1:32-1063(+)
MAATDFRVGTTINQFISAMERRHPEATGALSVVLMEIAIACKLIASKIQRAGITDLLGKVGTENATGDTQAKLDVQSNIVMCERLLGTGHVAAIVSEEEEDIVYPSDASVATGAHYIVACDPLDGSSNIDCNGGVGTFVGIWKRVTPAGTPIDPKVDVLQCGRALVASGFVMYSSSVIFVLTLGKGTGVHGFTLDPTIGEFVLSHENVRFPAAIKNYSVNEGNSVNWSQGMKDYIAWCKETDKATARPYGARYAGAMCVDIFRTILYGGIFMYPADAKNKDGKLRLMYELVPTAFCFEEAGGKASSGAADILDIVPTSIHHRSPFFGGTAAEVERAVAFVSRG